MPRISDKKKEKISEHLLSIIYSKSPQTLFTSKIAEEIARDEEFTKNLLFELKDKGFVNPITKNPKGVNYKKRIKWRLSNKAHEAYSNHI